MKFPPAFVALFSWFTGSRLPAFILTGFLAIFGGTELSAAVPSISSSATATGQVGVAFNYQITATNTPTSFGATGLPAGLTVSTTTGLISGSPTTAATSSVTLKAINASGTGTKTLTLTVNPPKPVVNSATTASGQTGVAFSYQITATNSPTGFTATPLPAGVTLNATSGLISGTPTAAGTTSVSLAASNVSGASAAVTLTITVTLSKPVVNSATTASGQTGVAFSYQITATNSPTSFTATPLPAGLTLNAATGLISGTPTAVGTTSVSLTASNASGASPAKTVTITVTLGKPVITSATTASGQVGTGFNYQITATNSPTSFTATPLPAGVTLNATSGLISGTPTAAGTTTVSLTASNATGASPVVTLTITVSPGKPVITSATTASGQTGVAFSYQITATNSPTSFTATPLPAGVTLNATSGLISGTPTGAGTTSVSLTASNASGASAAVTLTLTVTLSKPVVNSATTASGQTGVAFSYQITATNSPTSFTATPLPAGLTLNASSGLISGTPTAVGTTSVSLTASNASGASAGKTLTITVTLGKPVITSATTVSGQTGLAFSYQITATNSPTSFTATPLPAGVTLNATTGLVSGTPSAVGTTSVSLTASNAAGASPVITLTITVAAGKPVITSATTASGQTGVAFSYQITATNSPTGFTAAPLPAGVTLNTTTGLISGTTTAVGTTSVSLTASNASGTSTAVTLTIAVTLGKPVITSATTVSGQTGVAFNYQITATNSPTSFTATPMPAGVTLNATTGLISGTPTVVGTTSVSLTATNATGTSPTVILTITVTLGKPVITSATTASGQTGATFSYQITATNTPTGFTATPLPIGMTLNATSGLISGTPTAAGTTSVSLTATNAAGISPTVILVITVTLGKPAITSATTSGGQTGVGFNYQITATNSPTSFTATPLPTGVTLNTTTGLISGTPTTVGTTSVSLTATNAAGTSPTVILTITLTLGKPVITSPTAASGQTGVAFSYQITATNSPTGFTAAPLPAGITLNATTGLISGTPTVVGTTNISIGATNGAGSGSAVLVLTINPPAPAITSATTATGKVGTPLSYQIVATNNPTSYGVTGSLPTGLSVDTQTGLISGTPTAVGVTTVTVTATNAGGTGSLSLAITFLASLPYTSDFEVAEGYVLGSLSGQFGWLVPQGTALITAQDSYSGSQSVQLPASSPPVQITQTFGASAGEGIIFFDFFAKPVAESDPTLATTFIVEKAKFAFKQNGSLGVLQVFNGNGSGGGNWSPTKFSIPLGANNQAQAWLRLTARLDFGLHTWDLYANGNMVAADVGVLASTSYLSTFQMQGDAGAASGVDYIYAGPLNPVFAPNDDTNNNGIDDAWETAHGLSLQTNNRNLSPAGNGTTVVQAYINGTDPNDFYNGVPPTLAIVSGNNQVAPAGQFNPLAFDIGVWNTGGTAPLVNAPVMFTVQSGGGKLALTKTGSPTLANSLSLTTDVNGTAQVYYLQPSVASTPSVVTLTAGTAQATFNTSSAANVDSDHNGLADTWEIQHFGHIGVDPSADPDNDGLTNLQEFTLGTDPNVADTDGDGVKDGLEVSLGMNPLVADAQTLPVKIGGLRLFLKADTGVLTDGAGLLSVWQDQSTLHHDAVQSNSSLQPVVVANQVNGRPVVRFNGSNTYFQLGDFMNGATAGEAFFILKSASTSGHYNGLWNAGGGSTYYPTADGLISEGFGVAGTYTGGIPAQSLDQYNLYNVSAQNGPWSSRINETTYITNSANSVYFYSAPVLGSANGNYFAGDIAEVIVYDHALSDSEREAVGQYLTAKFAPPGITVPAAPTNLSAASISSTRINLSWTAPLGEITTIERQSGSGDYAFVAEVSNGLGYTDTGLSPNTAYNYRIKSRNYAGSSGYGNVASATTLIGGGELPATGMRLWLEADRGLIGAGALGVWQDQSGSHHDAVQTNGSVQPVVVANQVNGRPVVRFNGSNSYFQLDDFMNGATAGEAFFILKSTSASGHYNGLWSAGGGSSYYPAADGSIWEAFGASGTYLGGIPTQSLNQFSLYDVSAQNGPWSSRINGTAYLTNSANTATFSSAPVLGSSNSSYFAGDIAEVIVYDHVLSDSDRDAVGQYLTAKFAPPEITVPAAPTNLSAVAISSTRMSLAWEASLGGTATIERQSGSGDYAFIAEVSNGVGYTDAGLSSNTTYNYRVKNISYAGGSAYSNVVSATTLSGGDDLPVTGMRLWLQANRGLIGGGTLAIWQDQSGSHHDAVQTNGSEQPVVIATQVNGRPVVHFNGSTSYFQLGDFMNGANAGEVFFVLKSTPVIGHYNGLWYAGGGYTYYPSADGSIQESFGTTSSYSGTIPTQPLDQYHLYNVSAQSGSWSNRINGASYIVKATNTVAFSATALLGTINGNYFDGDIAEIIVYDHVLTGPEREAVTFYLSRTYALNLPVSVTGVYGDRNGDGLSDLEDVNRGIDPFNMDVDGDGIPNAVEIANGTNPFDADTDHDGVPDGLDAFPTDPLRWDLAGTPPALSIISGNGQITPTGQFDAQALSVVVRNSAGTVPLINVPVTITVQNGGGHLALTNTGGPAVSSTLNLFTDANGQIQVFYQQPNIGYVQSTIQITAGTGTVTFTSTSTLLGDIDGNQLADAWEIQHFGQTGIDPSADPDGDGLTNLQEFQQGSDPHDFYNATAPVLEIVSGNNQTGTAGQFNALPLVISLKNVAGTAPLANSPIVFTVLTEGGSLTQSISGTPVLSTSLTLMTDSNGRAQVYYQQPSAANLSSTIRVKTGLSEVQFQTSNFTSGTNFTDSDHNGLSDAWEIQYFGAIGVDPNADPDGDGLTNLQEFQQGSNPTKNELPDSTGAVNLRVYSPSR